MGKKPQKRGFILTTMTKIRRITDLQCEFSFFSPQENFDAYYERFLASDLGKIHSAIPFDELVKTFRLQESQKGPKSIFSSKGKIALMFLKHYAGVSDKKLVEQLNANVDYQFFCDVYIGSNRIKNYKIVSEIRVELSKKLKIDKLEQTLYNHWSAYIDDKHSITTDATCYESEVRYPTDQKLLWEAVDWSHEQMRFLYKTTGQKLPRTKYRKWAGIYVSYSKMRRKTKSKKTSITRALLRLLKKINGLLDDIEKQFEFEFSQQYTQRRETIKTIYKQQLRIFKTGQKPKGRIVSIHKDYLRPIVRGKEIKAVEFGAKVNKLQINGINFIEHLSFEAFNEGTRFKNTIFKAQSLTRVRVKLVGADAIYATNKNRVFATRENIKTDFKPKGKPPKNSKEVKKLKSMITKERASRLEGSFGKEKEHYHLKKIKAKTKETETLWIFFGIHTANALEIGRRIWDKKQEKVA